MNMIKGYKVFDPNWTCNGKKYECPGIFEEDVTPSCCNYGIHFCQNLADCFYYYDFNPKNKVAEVIAIWDTDTNGNKICTNKLKIVREIQWDEVLRIVNSGTGNTGYCNSGDYNSGNYNSGYRNGGDYNTGYCNSGNYNSGNYNSGYRNSGNYNSGYRNSGDYNSGNYNSGGFNSGDYNSGYRNSGYRNSGNYNSGYRNSGDYNSGYHNSGDYNKTNFSSGCFNTKEANIMLFDKMSNWTYRTWLGSDARRLLTSIPRCGTKWVTADDMTTKEKIDNPTYKTTGGYLKILDEPEIVKKWWDDLPESDKEIIKSIPNFDPYIFEECTGIKVQ